MSEETSEASDAAAAAAATSIQASPLASNIVASIKDNMSDKPAAPAAPGSQEPEPGPNDWMFKESAPAAPANPNGPPKPKIPGAPATPEAKPAGTPGAAPAATPGEPAPPSEETLAAINQALSDGAIDKLVGLLMPDAPAFLANSGDQAQLDSWQKVKGALAEATNKLASTQMRLATRPAVGPDGTLPETDAVKALQAQIAELQPLAEKAQKLDARAQLEVDPEFQRRFHSTRSAILTEVTAAARKAGITNPGEAAEEFLKLETGIEMEQWAAGQVKVDEDADSGAKQQAEVIRSFLAKQGAEFRSLTAEANQTLETPDPIAQLKQYRDYEAAFGTEMAVKMGDAISAQFKAAVPGVRRELTDPQTGDPQFFSTDAGISAMDAVTRRVSEGKGISPAEVIRALAKEPRGDAYRVLAEDLTKQVVALEQRLVKLGALDPGRDLLFGSATPTPKGAEHGRPSNMPDITPKTTEPLISSDELAAAMNRRPG